MALMVDLTAKLLPRIEVSSLPMYVRVALPVPRLEALTYLVDTDDALVAGVRVVVPLGKRTLTGTVVEVNVEPVEGTKAILEILDERPTFSRELLELTRRVAEYYLCSWGEVLHAAVPSGMQPNVVMRIHVERPLSTSEYESMKRKAPKRAHLLRILDESKGDVTVAYLQKQAATAYVGDQLDALVRDGWISISIHESRPVKGRTVRCVRLADDLLAESQRLRAALDHLDSRAPKQSLALAFVAMHKSDSPLSVATLADSTGVGVSSIDALIEKGLLSAFQTDYAYGYSGAQLVQRDERSVDLTNEQQAAVTAIEKSIGLQRFDVHMLQGVTGSGKTIVYQRIIDGVLRQKKRALVLVPEIALTPQLGDRFAALYGSRVAVLHSRVSMGERVQTWNRIARGEVDVVLGARSSVYVNLPDLGVIIVDEEHEPSYKQDEPSPRYHGRDVAMMRGQIEHCPVVLGSATPSLESYHNVVTKRFSHHRLTTRADGALFPEVRVVDMRAARKTRQVEGAFAVETLIAMAERIRQREGVLVFMNKRGYASHMQCGDCGAVPTCEHCDVALTFHKHPNVLRCHYCGFTEQFHSACTTCGSTEVQDVGTGTQRLEEELTESLRSYIDRSPMIARMDADSTARKGQHRNLLQQFSDGTIDVLVGTQMVAKGLDIERCTLVVVANADQSLYHADFRASERTLQLLLQVSGRAGRHASKPGSVLLQSFAPEHPTMQMCQQGERNQNVLLTWYESEYATRREVVYPPFARFIVVEVKSSLEHLAQQHAEILHALLPKNEPTLTCYPASPPSVPRVRNVYRRIIVIKNDKQLDPSGQVCRSYLRAMINEYTSKHGASDVRVAIDVDARGSW